MEQEERGWFVRVKDYLYENDAFLYLGGLVLCVSIFMGWALHRETEKSALLQKDILELKNTIAKNNTEIFNLKLELEKKTTPQIVPPAPDQIINERASKLNQKIDKVQDALIPSAVAPKTLIKTETKVKNVETQTKLDKELQHNMFESFCNAQPTHPKCKR